MEPNLGPDNNTPPHGVVRTLAQNYERNSSGQNPKIHCPGELDETPLVTQKTNPHPPLEDNTAQELLQNEEHRRPSDHRAEGFSYPPPPKRRHRQTPSTKTTATH